MAVIDSKLERPPRLVNPNAETAYNWREFDRWLQKLYALLNRGTNAAALNIFNELANKIDKDTPLTAVKLQMQNGSEWRGVPVDNGDGTYSMAFECTKAATS